MRFGFLYHYRILSGHRLLNVRDIQRDCFRLFGVPSEMRVVHMISSHIELALMRTNEVHVSQSSGLLRTIFFRVFMVIEREGRLRRWSRIEDKSVRDCWRVRSRSRVRGRSRGQLKRERKQSLVSRVLFLLQLVKRERVRRRWREVVVPPCPVETENNRAAKLESDQV